MPAWRKNGRFAPDPAPYHPVPVGDPIDTTPGSRIHKVASWTESPRELPSGNSTLGLKAVTVCGLETGRLRPHYPRRGEPCPKCWPDGIIACKVSDRKFRTVVDNTKPIPPEKSWRRNYPGRPKLVVNKERKLIKETPKNDGRLKKVVDNSKKFEEEPF